MDGRSLQDRIHRAAGMSARAVGQLADAYRPQGPVHPLDAANRYLRLPALFVPATGRAARTNVFGDPFWHGIFDASYTKPGDYVVLNRGTYFIASQAPLLPVLCVIANRTLSITRSVPISTPDGAYGGYTAGSTVILMDRWPASVLSASKTSSPGSNLPTDVLSPYWSVLIPAPSGIVLSPGDLISDDLGRSAVISGSELTDLGWRVVARLVTT